ncbi:hypothetical protein GAGA_4357 [Paraglaciecola agarilytica NO2]|uniref:Uncharacterized protein n=1 Tax=Paraglaciecola agarilytica NO2 TaxID=1125747 RepID=A0ABQ0ID03_9ALTE|nr:hypothetical protein GAGA_4357 [Paraglaciecola agarilytica NO2]
MSPFLDKDLLSPFLDNKPVLRTFTPLHHSKVHQFAGKITS